MPKFILTQAAFRVGVKLMHMLCPLSLDEGQLKNGQFQCAKPE
jgi:hypothetical protein